MKVLLHGCNGRMGQVLKKVISEAKDIDIAAGVDTNPDFDKNDFPVFKNILDVDDKINSDVLIDFSNHACINNLLDYCVKNNLPAVICTTGFTEDEKAKILEASKKIPVFRSANMSIGINLILSLAKQAAKTLYEDFDIEIIEKHHNQKLDSPSGTALMIADAIKSSIPSDTEYTYGRHGKTTKREKREIGIHAVRGGNIVGDHSVIFAGAGEVIEINHSAISREVFAVGAIKAAKFINNKPAGIYSMEDIIL